MVLNFQVKKETKSLWDYEASFLLNYRVYLEFLETMAKSRSCLFIKIVFFKLTLHWGTGMATLMWGWQAKSSFTFLLLPGSRLCHGNLLNEIWTSVIPVFREGIVRPWEMKKAMTAFYHCHISSGVTLSLFFFFF